MDLRFASGQVSAGQNITSQAKIPAGLRNAALRCLPVLAILFFTFVFRSQHFGSPDIDFDEPFYLLAGDKLLHGSVIYTDIWDRKPIGLFLIYAFACLFGEPGFLQYQLLAATFAAGTGCFIWIIAQRFVGRWQAVIPAILYVIWQEPYTGGGGQAAIFYNLFTITCLWLALTSKDNGDLRAIRRAGMIAMALMGCALQVKYTVLPEGCFFGLTFLVLLHRRQERPSGIVRMALIFVGIAIAPTALVALYYLVIGHFRDFFYANFTSLFDRLPLKHSYVETNLLYIFIVAAPLIICAALGFARLRRMDKARGYDDHLLLGLWTIAASIGFAMIGNFYWYYFMPMLLPLVLLCAPLLAERGLGLLVAALLICWPMHVSGYWSTSPRDKQMASTAALTALIEQNLRGRCLFIYDGPVTLYQTTHACIPTKFAYPDHLSNDVERLALGVDAEAEMRRIIATHPGVIVTSSKKVVPIRNAANDALVAQALRDHYEEIGSVLHKGRPIEVYALRRGNALPNQDERADRIHTTVASAAINQS